MRLTLAKLILVLLAVITCQTSFAQTGTDKTSALSAYLIGPGDVVDISVWKEEGMERQVVVRPDGKISFPLVGDIQAGGKTTEQLQLVIKGRLKKFIPDAVVMVGILQVNSNVVYVLGKVARPGQFIAKHYVDVTQALAMAGGLTPHAAANSIKVLRRVGLKQIVFEFEYGDVEDGENLKQNIILNSGDVIIVP